MKDSFFTELPEDEQNRFREQYEKFGFSLLEARLSSGMMYIRHLVFMNGGALVAILAAAKVIGSEWLWLPMPFFFLGLVLAVWLNGKAYRRFMTLGSKRHGLAQRFLSDAITKNRYMDEQVKLDECQNSLHDQEHRLGKLGFASFIVGSILGIFLLYWNR